MGQCFPLPDDENLKDAMAKHAHNHEFIFNQYNFDVDTPAGLGDGEGRAAVAAKEGRGGARCSPEVTAGTQASAALREA